MLSYKIKSNKLMLIYKQQQETRQNFDFLSSNEGDSYVRFMGGNITPLLNMSALSSVDINNWYNPSNFKGQRNPIKNPVIVIVNCFTTPNITKDLATFCNTFKLPLMNGLKDNNGNIINDPTLGKFSIYYQNTNATRSYTASYSTVNKNSFVPNNNGWGLEINLDIQYAHTIAPYADIVLILAKSNSVANLTTAVKFGNTIPNAVSLSMSWGANENRAFTTVDSMFNNTTNIIHTAASGDSGSAGGIIWPSANPNVVSVGGTTINKSGTSYSEVAWSGSGGGASAIYNKPLYQSSITLKTKRMNPDISMLAAPSISVCDSFYSTSGWVYNVGGTSLASPMVAALVALAIQYKYPTGNWSNITKTKFMQCVYNLPSNTNYKNTIYDVVSGNNGGFQTKVNYDLVTGVGSPKITNILNTINGLLYSLTN
jgi:subtilase family serine protease